MDVYVLYMCRASSILHRIPGGIPCTVFTKYTASARRLPVIVDCLLVAIRETNISYIVFKTRMSFLKSALLVGLTAIAVVVVPKFMETPPPVTIDGYVAPGFEEILEVFRKNYESGLDSPYGGSAFAAYHKGKKVVDIWGGYADAQSQRKWKEDTMSTVFSTTKGVASICIAMLVDRGLLDYDKPVADYWPEFGQKGKDKITVRQMMEHKAGLILAAPPGLNLEVMKDVAKAGELMASADQFWVPDGKAHGYHGYTFGPLTNELLRRVDPQHRTMGQFFKEEIAEPFGIDFYIGLPLELNHRVARLMPDERSPLLVLASVLFCPRTRAMMLHMLRTGIFAKIMKNSNEMGNLAVFNDPAYRALEIPSVNGVGSASGLAKLYNILAVGGKDPLTNKTLMSKKQVEGFLDAEPPSADIVVGYSVAFSRGMVVFDKFVDGVKMFGHTGAGGQESGADPVNQVSFGYVTRYMQSYVGYEDVRFTSLIQTMYKCINNMDKK